MSLGKIAVRLVADLSAFDSGLAKAEAKVSRWAGRLTKTGQRLTGAATLPILGFLGFATAKASDLYESVNKVQVVFGDAADSVLAFARNADTSLGISSQAALEAAATYGNLFESVGLAEDASADMSMRLVQLASDLASFNNLDPSEVLRKLQSGLVGEVEPLRALGINLSANAVKAKALAMGLAETADKLTPAMLMQARYTLILEQSQNAMGDFARTSNGVANSTRIVKAQLLNLAAGLGSVLLPYAMKALDVGKRLLGWLNSLSPQTRAVIVGVLGLAAAVGPLLWLLGSFLGALSSISAAMGGLSLSLSGPLLPILALVAAVGLLAVAWKKDWGGIQEKTAAVWTFLQPVLAQLGALLKEGLTLAVQGLSAAWAFLQPVIEAVGNYVQGVLWPALQVFSGWLATVGRGFVMVFGAVWQGVLLPALKLVWQFISAVLWPIFKAVARFTQAVFVAALRALGAIFETYVLPAMQAVGQWLDEHLMPIFEKVADFISTALMPVWDALGGAISKVADFIGDVVGKLDAMAQKLANLELPDWLTPGSPTPWEIGLLGINKALERVSRHGLPRMAAQLDVVHRVGPAVPAVGYEGSSVRVQQTPAVVVNLHYAPAVALGDRVEAERVLAPMVAEQVRAALAGA